MKEFQERTLFSFPLGQVVQGFFKRYDNSGHVKKADFLSVDVRNGVLYTKKLLWKTKMKYHYNAIEEVIVNMKTGIMMTYTRNISATHMAAIEEKGEYVVGNKDLNTTIATRYGFVKGLMGWSYLENKFMNGYRRSGRKSLEKLNAKLYTLFRPGINPIPLRLLPLANNTEQVQHIKSFAKKIPKL